jgi:MFS family permease
MLKALKSLSAHRYLLGFGFLMVFLSGHGQTFLLSLYGGVLREAFALSHSAFGGLYSLATLMSGMLVIWLGRGVDRIALGRITTGVIAGAACGGLMLAGAQAAWMLVPAFLLLRLCGQGLMVHVAQTTVARRIEHRRGSAISVITLGFPLGEALLPASVVGLMAMLGWRASWVLLAGLLLLLALPLALWLIRAEAATRPALPSSSAPAVGDAKPAVAPEWVGWTRGEVLKDRRFYQILPALLAPSILITALFFHQVPIAQAKGWSLALVSTAFTVYAITHVAALLLSGPLIDRVGARRLLGVYLLPLLMALGVVGFWPGALAAPLYLGLAGLCVGTSGTLMGALWPELYGVRHLGAIRAMAHGAMVLGTAAGPVLIGLLLDAGLQVAELAMAMATYLVVAMLLVWPVAMVSPPVPSAPR